jgi:pimeloyl-ACP methyl ester carboxylesterase
MTIAVPFKNGRIRVKDEGKGDVVVLLHGYLESLDIWDTFAGKLAEKCRVISLDIPGHGQSSVVADVHTMSLMAEGVHTVMQYLDIQKFVLAGHSMGGYVSLAYLAEYPEHLAGICLFHSTPFADTEKKKASRAKEIRLIRAGKFTLICNTSVPNGFADDNLSRMPEKVEFAKEIARRNPPGGVIALLEGMRQRPDRQELLQNNRSLPLLFILGKKDNYIPFDKIYPVAKACPCSTVSVLEETGHSGFLEEPEKSAGFVLSFLDKCHIR